MANFYINPIDDEERPYSGMKFYISDEDKLIIRDMIEKLNDALATATFKDAAENLINSFERNNSLLSRLTEVIESMPYSRTESIISGLEELKNRLDAMGSSDNDEIKARLGELNSLMQENNIIIEKSLEAFSQKSKEMLSGVEGLKNEINIKGEEAGLAELKELMSVKDNRMLSNVSEIRSMLQENNEMLERNLERIAQKENDAISGVAETNTLIQESNEILERNLEILSKKESAILTSFEEIKDILQKKDDQIQMPLNELKELLAENSDRITSNINDVASLLQDNNTIVEKNLEILSKKDSTAISGINELKEAIYGLKDTLTKIRDSAPGNVPEISLEGINAALQENYGRILPEIAVYKKDTYEMISQKDSEDIARFESISEAMNKIHSEISSIKSDAAAIDSDFIEIIKNELSRFSDDIKKLKAEPLANLKEEMKVIESVKDELSRLSNEIKKIKQAPSADLKEEIKVIESIKSDVFSIFNEIKTLKEAIIGTSAKPGKVGIKGLKKATEEIKELKASLAEMNSTVNAINTLNSYLYSAYDINNLLLALQTSSSKMPDWAERKQKQLMLNIRSTLDELVDLSIIKSLNESEKNIAQLTADVPADDELVKNRLDALIKADKVTIIKKGDKISYGLAG